MDRREGPPASTVFVGNLSYDLTDQDVIDFFSQVGPVKTVRIVTERDTGKPRGFGFVEFFDIPTAESAIRNLSGTDFNGRTIRIVYADGGPFDSKPRGGGDDRGRFDDRRGPPPPQRDRVVGGDLAYHSGLGVASLLGAPAAPGVPADQITALLARKTRSELYDYLAQMQGLLRQNPHQARELLVGNPQLSKALFQMQVILGLVGNPLGDVAPKGIAPPSVFPSRHGHGALEPGPPGGPEPAPPMGQGPQPMGQGPLPGIKPPPMGQGPPPMGYQGAPPMQAAALPMQPPPYMQPPPQQANGYQPPPMQQVPPPMGGYQPAPMQQQPQYLPPEPLPPAVPMAPPTQPMQPLPADPRLGTAAPPVDPRRAPGTGVAPRPMVSLAHAQHAAPPAQQPAPVPAQAPPAAPVGAGMTPEQQQALLQQVMSLTPQQIEQLPPAQKAQVLALQQQLVRAPRHAYASMR
eukprot:scaffold3.g6185.t1